MSISKRFRQIQMEMILERSTFPGFIVDFCYRTFSLSRLWIRLAADCMPGAPLGRPVCNRATGQEMFHNCPMVLSSMSF